MHVCVKDKYAYVRKHILCVKGITGCSCLSVSSMISYSVELAVIQHLKMKHLALISSMKNALIILPNLHTSLHSDHIIRNTYTLAHSCRC